MEFNSHLFFEKMIGLMSDVKSLDRKRFLATWSSSNWFNAFPSFWVPFFVFLTFPSCCGALSTCIFFNSFIFHRRTWVWNGVPVKRERETPQNIQMINLPKINVFIFPQCNGLRLTIRNNNNQIDSYLKQFKSKSTCCCTTGPNERATQYKVSADHSRGIRG